MKPLSLDKQIVLAAATIALCTAAAYANSFAGAFIFDDTHDIVENAAVRNFWSPAPRSTANAENPGSGHPRPVVILTFAANYAWSGLHTWSYHVVNLAIHVLAALTLFGIARRTMLSPACAPLHDAALPLALVIALVWAVHPLQTQAVAYIVQRYESLMGLFYLQALYCAIRAAGGRHAWLWQIGSVIACLLAMGCKEVAVSAPLVVLLYDRAFLAGSFRGALRARSPLYLGLAASWLVWLPVYLSLSGGGGQWAGSGAKATWLQYALSQPGVILHYLRLCFWPSGQCFDYDWPVAQDAAAIVPPAAILLALIGLTLWSLWRWPAWGFLGASFF